MTEVYDSIISFREYTPKDHDGFINCINDFYRGGYPYKEYLEADFLRRESEAGNMIITIAATSSGKIVGTSAALRASGAFGETILLLLRCVLTEYRNKGIGSMQEHFLFELIAKRFSDARSIYADVMTHSPASQITLEKNGFAFCGLRFMLYKNEIMVPALNYAPGTKMTQAIYCKPVKQKSTSLCCMPQFRDTVSAIYDEMGVQYEFIPDSQKLFENSSFTYEEIDIHKKTEFIIEKVGKDFDDTVIALVKDKLAHGHTLVAYLNLCNQGCTKGYEALHSEGFFFAGIKPLSSGGEYLVLSHIKNCVGSFENIKVPANRQKFLDDIIGGLNSEQ